MTYEKTPAPIGELRRLRLGQQLFAWTVSVTYSPMNR